MTITPDSAVGEIAAAYPETVRVFESKQIDYCCGGNQKLGFACQEKHFDTNSLIQELEEVIEPRSDGQYNWSDAPLRDLMHHIVSEYHVRCRAESERLESLMDAVARRHGAEHPELMQVQRLFSVLSKELAAHMVEEEHTLFPNIEQLECGKHDQQPRASHTFNSAATSIHEMLHDHDEAGVLLRKLRDLTNGYAIPRGACNSYRGLLYGLSKFERSLHAHVHLENNILFPRANELRKAVELPRELRPTVAGLPSA